MIRRGRGFARPMPPSYKGATMHVRALFLSWSVAASLLACAAEPGAAQSAGSTADTSSTGADAPTSGEPPGTHTEPDASSGGASSTVGGTGETDTSTSGADAGTDTSTGSSSTSDASSGDASSTGDGAGLGPEAQAAMAALMAAVDGVTYPSESDYPWTVVGLADAAPVSEANVKDVIAGVYVPHKGEAGLADRAIEVKTLAQLFDPLTVPQDWWTDDEFMRAEDYTKIRDVLAAELTNIQVFRIGEQSGNILQGAIDVYVLGEVAGGDLVGMWTVSVET